MSNCSRTWSERVETSDSDDFFILGINDDKVETTPSAVQINSQYAVNK